ncbi:MAG TPA: endonuclease/exonuclease/phosphatase family protein [Gemmatimonadaceae bacterium]|nr:endonuclease/exonuclease/phosphatase family protein [Gemmatimonadaceae bacterium]
MPGSPVLTAVGIGLAVFTVLATALSLTRWKFWLARIWDFPRVQVALVGVLALALGAAGGTWWEWPQAALGVVLVAAVAYQSALVWRYTRLAPREVQESRAGDPARRISLVVSNVLQPSREADRLLAIVRAADPDVVLCVETDDWWAARLEVLAATHRHAVRCPLPNTYGMLLFSRLPLEEAAVEFLVEKDVPSIQARVRLANGDRVWLNCVHPRPPAPQERKDSLVRARRAAPAAPRGLRPFSRVHRPQLRACRRRPPGRAA